MTNKIQITAVNFIEVLTKIVTGLDVSRLDQKTKTDLEEKSLRYFNQSIYSYILDKYGEKHAIHIKVAQKDTKVFKKFPDLVNKLDEAWNDFFKQYKY